MVINYPRYTSIQPRKNNTPAQHPSIRRDKMCFWWSTWWWSMLWHFWTGDIWIHLFRLFIITFTSQPFIVLPWLTLSLPAVPFQLTQLLPALAYSVTHGRLCQPGLHPSASGHLFLQQPPGDAGRCCPRNGLARRLSSPLVCLSMAGRDAWCLSYLPFTVFCVLVRREKEGIIIIVSLGGGSLTFSDSSLLIDTDSLLQITYHVSVLLN